MQNTEVQVRNLAFKFEINYFDKSENPEEARKNLVDNDIVLKKLIKAFIAKKAKKYIGFEEEVLIAFKQIINEQSYIVKI